MADFNAIFDSVILLQQGETDLSGTLFYKLMTICGNFLSFNEGKAKQVCWVEQTRSSIIQPEEKQQLLEEFPMEDSAGVESGDGNLMAIGL